MWKPELQTSHPTTHYTAAEVDEALYRVGLDPAERTVVWVALHDLVEKREKIIAASDNVVSFEEFEEQKNNR